MQEKKSGDKIRQKYCKRCDQMRDHQRKIKFRLPEINRLYTIYTCTECGLKFSQEESY